MTWIYYLLEGNCYLGVFYLLYYFVLRTETFYQLNRAYLLISSVLAFAIPFFQLGFLKPADSTTYVQIETQTSKPILFNTSPITIEQGWTIANYIIAAYLLVVTILFVNLVFKIFKLLSLSRKHKNITNNSYKLVETAEDYNAFSFFNYLFISRNMELKDTIIHHELIHIRQKHSWDVIYIELLKIINWFNPVVYMLQYSMKELHEFIADQETVDKKLDTNSYTDFLVNNAYGVHNHQLTNTFFSKSLIKKRIIMLHQKRSGSLARLKHLIVLPVLAALLCASTLSFSKTYGLIDLAPKYQESKSAYQDIKKDDEPGEKVTSKGYKYIESGYLVKGKADFRVIIIEKDNSQKAYFRNSATATEIDLLKNKYGYTFPTMDIYPKLPPPPPAPMAAPAPSLKRSPPPPPAPPIGNKDEKMSGRRAFPIVHDFALVNYGKDKVVGPGKGNIAVFSNEPNKVAPIFYINDKKYIPKDKAKPGQNYFVTASDSVVSYRAGGEVALKKFGKDGENDVTAFYGKVSVIIK